MLEYNPGRPLPSGRFYISITRYWRPADDVQCRTDTFLSSTTLPLQCGTYGLSTPRLADTGLGLLLKLLPEILGAKHTLTSLTKLKAGAAVTAGADCAFAAHLRSSAAVADEHSLERCAAGQTVPSRY